MHLRTPQVERVLAMRFGVAKEGRTALRGRLEHLRRLGTPAGIKKGQGRAATYGWDEFLELIVAVELLAVGLTPEHAHRIASTQFGQFRQAFALLSFELGAQALEAVESRRVPPGISAEVLVTADAFAGMRSPNAQRALFATTKSEHFDIHDLPSELLTARVALDVAPIALRLLHAMSMTLDLPRNLLLADFKEWAIDNVQNP